MVLLFSSCGLESTVAYQACSDCYGLKRDVGAWVSPQPETALTFLVDIQL